MTLFDSFFKKYISISFVSFFLVRGRIFWPILHVCDKINKLNLFSCVFVWFNFNWMKVEKQVECLGQESITEHEEDEEEAIDDD